MELEVDPEEMGLPERFGNRYPMRVFPFVREAESA